jgi:hypothetical protein
VRAYVTACGSLDHERSRNAAYTERLLLHSDTAPTVAGKLTRARKTHPAVTLDAQQRRDDHFGRDSNASHCFCNVAALHT